MKKEDKIGLIFCLAALVFLVLYIVQRQIYYLVIGICFVCLAAIMKNKVRRGRYYVERNREETKY